MVKVLFVCLGNICRSPIGEASFRALVKEKGLNKFFSVDSAGTAGYHIGKIPDRRTLEVLDHHGIQTKHLARKLSINDFEEFDHIAVMDEANFEFVHNLFHKTKKKPPGLDKLFLIRDYDPMVEGISEVPDPYYESKKAFEEVYTILFRSNQALLAYLIDKHGIILPDDKEEETLED